MEEDLDTFFNETPAVKQLLDDVVPVPEEEDGDNAPPYPIKKYSNRTYCFKKLFGRKDFKALTDAEKELLAGKTTEEQEMLKNKDLTECNRVFDETESEYRKERLIYRKKYPIATKIHDAAQLAKKESAVPRKKMSKRSRGDDSDDVDYNTVFTVVKGLSVRSAQMIDQVSKKLKEIIEVIEDGVIPVTEEVTVACE